MEESLDTPMCVLGSRGDDGLLGEDMGVRPGTIWGWQVHVQRHIPETRRGWGPRVATPGVMEQGHGVWVPWLELPKGQLQEAFQVLIRPSSHRMLCQGHFAGGTLGAWRMWKLWLE